MSHTNEDWCELWEPEMQCYCDIFRSSKHQQFVQFSEQTRSLQHSVKQPDILLQVYFIQSKASLSTPPGHWNWATEEKVFKVVQNISFLFALPKNFLIELHSPIMEHFLGDLKSKVSFQLRCVCNIPRISLDQSSGNLIKV